MLITIKRLFLLVEIMFEIRELQNKREQHLKSLLLLVFKLTFVQPTKKSPNFSQHSIVSVPRGTQSHTTKNNNNPR